LQALDIVGSMNVPKLSLISNMKLMHAFCCVSAYVSKVSYVLWMISMFVLQEQWKISVNTTGSKRKERIQGEDDGSGDGGRRRKGGKRRRKDKKSKAYYEQEEEAEMEDDPEEMDEEDANQMNDQEDEGADRTRDNFVAAGLEDSDAEEDMVVLLSLYFIR